MNKAEAGEPPDPITATVATTLAGLAATAGSTIGIVKSLQGNKQAPQQQAPSPLAGESTTMSAGQKANLINTSPQGVLNPSTTARQTLLGN